MLVICVDVVGYGWLVDIFGWFVMFVVCCVDECDCLLGGYWCECVVIFWEFD